MSYVNDSTIGLMIRTPHENTQVSVPCTEDQAFAIEMLVHWRNSGDQKLVTLTQKRWIDAVRALFEAARKFKEETGNII